MALLVAENSDKNSLSSMVYFIPVLVGICELHPHFFLNSKDFGRIRLSKFADFCEIVEHLLKAKRVIS